MIQNPWQQHDDPPDHAPATWSDDEWARTAAELDRDMDRDAAAQADWEAYTQGLETGPCDDGDYPW